MCHAMHCNVCIFPRRIEMSADTLHNIALKYRHKNMILATKDGAVFKGNMHEDNYVYLLTSPLCPQWGPPNCTRQGNSPPTSIARRPRSPEVQTT